MSQCKCTWCYSKNCPRCGSIGISRNSMQEPAETENEVYIADKCNNCNFYFNWQKVSTEEAHYIKTGKEISIQR